MDNDVSDLMEGYNYLLTVAAIIRKVIIINLKRVSELESNVYKVLQHANKLTEELTNGIPGINKVIKYLILHQILNAFEAPLNSFAINETIIKEFAGCC